MESIYNDDSIFTSLIKDIKNILDTARDQAATAINAAMLNAYWKIGERIVMEEQGGKLRAEYGTASLKELSERLTLEFEKGFSPRNLRNYRQFFVIFPDWAIWNARVPNLTWTHVRALLRVTDKSVEEYNREYVYYLKSFANGKKIRYDSNTGYTVSYQIRNRELQNRFKA